MTCTVSLETNKGEQILSEQVDGSMNLPVTPEAWAKRFANFVKSEHRTWRYLEAAAGTLTIQGEELGQYVARFEREVLPLRWALQNADGKIVAKLIDDTDQKDSQPKILFCGMEHPARPIGRGPEKIRTGLVIEPPGGLLIAQHGQYRDTIIVSAVLAGTGFEGLGVAPAFNGVQDGSVSLLHAFRILDFWLNARLAGFHAGIRRQKIVDSFLIAIFAKLCGHDWARGETDFYTTRGSQSAIDLLQRKVQRRSGFGASLRRDYEQMADEPAARSQWYWEKASRYGICSNRKLCNFALQLAGQPNQLRRVCGAELEDLLTQVSENRTIIRGARLLALLCAAREHFPSSDLLPRWKW